jgi:hypothetical protein
MGNFALQTSPYSFLKLRISPWRIPFPLPLCFSSPVLSLSSLAAPSSGFHPIPTRSLFLSLSSPPRGADQVAHGAARGASPSGGRLEARAQDGGSGPERRTLGAARAAGAGRAGAAWPARGASAGRGTGARAAGRRRGCSSASGPEAGGAQVGRAGVRGGGVGSARRLGGRRQERALACGHAGAGNAGAGGPKTARAQRAGWRAQAGRTQANGGAEAGDGRLEPE